VTIASTKLFIESQPVRAQIKRDFVALLKNSLKSWHHRDRSESDHRGDVARWLLRPETRLCPVISITLTKFTIATRLLHLSVYQVLPKIKPDIEALLHHSIEYLNQSHIPTTTKCSRSESLPTQLTEKLVTDMSETAYTTYDSLEDVAAKLFNRLIQNFSEALETKKHNIQIQSLLLDLLEIKINYVKVLPKEVEKNLENLSSSARLFITRRNQSNFHCLHC